MAPTRRRRSAHDPGKVLVDLALTLADGGDCLSDLDALRRVSQIAGPASDPTAWRVIDSVDKHRLAAIDHARAAARTRVWEAGGRPDAIVLEVDATLVTAHSDKRFAAPTYKRGFGFHPLLCYLDGTREALAGILRPGNAGSNTAADQIALVDEALAQLPVATKADDPEKGEQVLLRADSASATHEFVAALRHRRIEFSIGFPQTEEVREAVLSVEEKSWVACISQEGERRRGAECAEIGHLLDLSSWPEGTRVICHGRTLTPAPSSPSPTVTATASSAS